MSKNKKFKVVTDRVVNDFVEAPILTKYIRYTEGMHLKKYGILAFRINVWRELPVDVADHLLSKVNAKFKQSLEKPEGDIVPLSVYEKEMNLIRSSC